MWQAYILLFSMMAISLIVSAGTVWLFLHRNDKFFCIWLYIAMTLLLISYMMSNIYANLFDLHDDNLLYLLMFLLPIGTFVNLYRISFTHPNLKMRAHGCISTIGTIILMFAQAFSFMEFSAPGSFNGTISQNPFERSIDFIYFSLATFTTTGFGDISPANSIARLAVSFEFIVAFIILVLAVNFFTAKKD